MSLTDSVNLARAVGSLVVDLWHLIGRTLEVLVEGRDPARARQ